VLADEVSADEVLADEVLADEVLADEVSADEVLADVVSADEVLADETEVLVNDAEVVETVELLTASDLLLETDVLPNVEEMIGVVSGLEVVRMEVELSVLKTGVLLDDEIADMVEESVMETNVLRLELESGLVRMLDGTAIGRGALELDLRSRIEVDDTIEELETGNRALFEFNPLLDPGTGLMRVVPLVAGLMGVLLTIELVDIVELIEMEDLVDDGTPEELIDVEGVVNAAGLKMTIAKVLPLAVLRLSAL